jgi:hypothetical protein
MRPSTAELGVPEQSICQLRREADKLLQVRLAAARQSSGQLTCWRLPDGGVYVLKARWKPGEMRSTDEISRSDCLRVYAEDFLQAPVALVDRKVIYKERVAGGAVGGALPVLPEGMRKHTDADYYRARGIRGGVIVVAVALHDVTSGNGATVVWPRTHVQRFQPFDAGLEGPVVPDVHAPDAQGVELLAPAGSILLWDARIVHSSGVNRTGAARRLAIFAYAAANRVPA